METFNNEIMGELLAGSLQTASVDASGWHDSNAGGGTTDGNYIQWLTISDQAKSVLADVERIKSNSMVPQDIPIYGYVYDCKTGQLVEIPKATAAGRVS
jgi:carbonic anhydrase